MSLFSTLNTGISGLGTNGLALSVVSDNISNLNTVGFKGSHAEFQDLIMQRLGSGKGQLGQGAFTGGVRQDFGQGSIETTSNASDLALDGRGFFAVRDAEGGTFYTRAGQFSMSAAGDLVNMVGMKLQGYTATNGVLSTAVGDINIPADPIAATPTTSVILTANLQAANGPYLPALSTTVPTSFADVTAGSHFTSSVTVYDSLGIDHQVTLAYTRTAANTWDFSAWVNGDEAGGTAGVPIQVGSGTLSFDGTGTLDATTSSLTTSAVTFTGANAQTIAFDMGLAATDVGLIGQQSSASSVNNVQQDGNGSGDLTSFDIGTEGMITGIYSNGETRILGQVTVANFRAETNLSRIGHNLYQATLESGQAVVGAAGTGGRGFTHAYAVEMSNVDLEKQFVKMIQSQKGYQASARVVSGADDMLQELMQIV